MQPARALEHILLGQRGHLYPWAPVCFALGIGTYFSLKFEPQLQVFAFMGAVCAVSALLLLLWRSVYAPLVWLLVLVTGGFLVAGLHAHRVAGPVLEFRYYGAVQGRIIKVDRSSRGSLRLMLDQTVLERMAPDKTPKRVRVSLSRAEEEAWVRPGSTVMLTALLSAPSGPVEPHGFDFQRHAWFLGLGAVGYTRTPLMLLEPAGQNKPILQIRHRFADFVRAQIAGENGAFAAAIMTGDRSAMSQETVTSLRRTNLAHLLAISGLHMGLLTGVVFAAMRYVLLLVPITRNRLPTRKLAAAVALVASFFYLLLSGGNVATERAFIMATVALGAVMFERRVFSLRAVATAALLVLALRPEALLGPGFQMSFAATTALVCVFAAFRDHRQLLGPRWLRPVSTVFVSSLVAGLATAPVAAAHFNQFAHYGLLANLLAVPLMGVVVIPSAVLALLLWPLGLSAIGFWIMEQGIVWILGVASLISGLEGARGTVVSPEPLVLVILALGALLFALWQGRLRLVGLVPVLAGFGLWNQTTRPEVLISADAKLVGVMAADGRVLSKFKGSGFAASNWLENDGDARDQQTAANGWEGGAVLGPVVFRHVWRKRDMADLNCARGEILVVAAKTAEITGNLPCKVYDLNSLAVSGAVALRLHGDKLTETTARTVTGRRLWNLTAP
ncbi:competence protein ComEC family protein [Lentibacter algarum]|uniref:ComEC/Rec2 family competence protein n=1 Tax=Lentibacter algarum TaxID=576131 RepID=UPI001C082FB0|nr:ComEC/Rec2 family competence protein [Lentibacter algarum]MBU2982440.1 competence protein ComEC family protein [Lentibacter algarum]